MYFEIHYLSCYAPGKKAFANFFHEEMATIFIQSVHNYGTNMAAQMRAHREKQLRDALWVICCPGGRAAPRAGGRAALQG